MTVKKQKYPIEFKDEAVKLVTEQGYSDQEAADAVDVPVAYIQKWKKLKEKQDERLILEGSKRDKLLLLRKENKHLKLEQNILKKAAAFFASELK